MADSSEQALYLSDTRAALLYFDKIGKIDIYAGMRGKTAAELKENDLYNFDLDENGRKTYDLGEKQVEIRLQNDLSLVLFDLDEQKEIKSIPKRGSDTVKYEEAMSDFEDKKVNIKAVAKRVCDELFNRFLNDEVYLIEEWKKHFFSNPVVKNVSKLIVWTQKDSTFTVGESGYISSDGAPYELCDCEIGIAHPMDMNPEDVANWQKYFAENNLKQPFAQIWEPVIDFAKVKENRYLGCGIPLYRFNNQEKHGIHLYTAKEYVYYKNRTEYTSIDILLSGCPIEWHMMEGDICNRRLTLRVLPSMDELDGLIISSAI